MNATDTHSVRDPMMAALKLREDLVVTPHISGAASYYAVEDPLRRKFYRVGLPEFTFISLLDGRTSIAAALGRAAKKLGRKAFTEQEGLVICRWLLECQLAHTDESAQANRLVHSAEKSARQRLRSRVNPLMVKLPLMNPDRLLTRLGPWLAWLLSWPFFLVWAATCAYAVYLATVGWDRLAASAMVILDQENWLRLALVWAALKLSHELAHGLACKKYGGTVPAAGVTFLFLAPLAYVDVTSSWRFRSKWQRIATSAAGMFVELFAAALAMIYWSNSSTGLAHHLALNVAVMAGFNTLLFNGNPLVQFDGYFILSDLLEIPNLYPNSRNYVVGLLRTLVLGCEPPASNLSPRKAAIVKVYAVVALAWRIVFFLALALALVGKFSHFGMLLAVILLSLGWGIPMVRTALQFIRERSQTRRKGRRVAAMATAVALLVTLGVLLLTRPAVVQSQAVVEYSPLTVVRAATPGFVREVRVRSGDLVEQGQVVAVLENQECMAELTNLQVTLQQSELKARMLYQENELAKHQAEQANQESLRKKLVEIGDRVAALTVRSPGSGHVFSPDLDSLVGRYLRAGDEIGFVGAERTKELRIAVYQDDLDLFLAQLGQTVRVRTRSGTGERFSARLVKASPGGSTELPHPAFAAPVGGPLAVKLKAKSPQASEAKPAEYELLAPAFLVQAELPPGQSPRVHAGELAIVMLQSPNETVGERLFKLARAWVRRRTSAPQTD